MQVEQTLAQPFEARNAAELGVKAALAIWLLSLLLMAILGSLFAETLLAATAISEAALAVPPLLLVMRRRGLMQSLNLVGRPIAKAFIMGLALGPVSIGLDALVNYPVSIVYPPPPEYVDAMNRIAPRTVPELAVWFLIILFTVGPGEELLSRGFVQQGFERRFGRRNGLLLASLLFGLSHLSPWSLVGTVAAGLVIGYFYQRNAYNLWTPIGVHVSHDWIAFTILYLSVQGA